MLDSLRWLGVPEATAQRVVDHPEGPYASVHALMAMLPETLRFHAERGIPLEISQATLSDLAAKLAEQDGEAMTKQDWLSRHFSGSLYRLGRLQFDRAVFEGEPVLEIHIPGDGPLTPAACDESIAQAAGFFARHFPEENHQRALCHSWLLDRQLNDYLSAETNILDFQRRFTVTDQSSLADEDVVNFIFGYDVDRSRLPQQTTLQRAIVSHLAEGNHWYHCTGSLVLPT
jgi:hypothetical protein